MRIPDLQQNSFILSELKNYLPEMEFWIAINNINLKKLDELICEMTLQGVSRPKLQPATIKGMIKGFIDLVFKYNGKYYIADYKSNWLGNDDQAYTLQNIRNEIIKERYDLQYVIYLFALHRLLKSRLNNYRYERDIGGAIYIFLRGFYAPSQGIHLELPPYELISQLEKLVA